MGSLFVGLVFSSGGKKSTCNAGDLGLIPGSGRSLEKEQATYSSILGLPCDSTGKESACSVGDLGWISSLRRSPGEGKRYPLQYSSLENSIDCIVHGLAKTEPLSFHSVYFCHLLISSTSVRSIPFLSFIVPVIA